MTPARTIARIVAAAAGLALVASGFDLPGSTEAVPPSTTQRTPAIALVSTTDTAFEKEVLRLVNKARKAKRKCGSKTYKAAKALTWNAKLATAAEAHSVDMSVKNYFSHTSKSGKSPFTRIKATGYKYKAAGETLAAGYATPKTVVNAWLKSTSHCKILMSKSYTQLGVGHYVGDGKYRRYTTANFAKPKK